MSEWMADAGLDKYDDPHAVIEAWQERMNLRWGPQVWDQFAREAITWKTALMRKVHGSHEYVPPLGVPVWTDGDVLVAVKWETESYPECRHWPLWAQPWDRKDKVPCGAQDHKWRLIIEDSCLRLECTDPCVAGPNCTAKFTGGNPNNPDNYDIGACITLVDCFQDVVLPSMEATINVSLVLEHEAGTWEVGYSDGYTRFHVEPTFDTDSLICGRCGCEVIPPHYARSRYDKDKKICPDCGHWEAMKQFELTIENETDDMEETNA